MNVAVDTVGTQANLFVWTAAGSDSGQPACNMDPVTTNWRVICYCNGDDAVSSTLTTGTKYKIELDYTDSTNDVAIYVDDVLADTCLGSTGGGDFDGFRFGVTNSFILNRDNMTIASGACS